MTKDALKFFQSYIREMIEIGGENLPKSISARLGAKLARLYKEKGITEIEDGLMMSYKVLDSKPKINKLDNKTYEVILKYPKKFCPIGGKLKNDPEWAGVLQDSICFAYTYGFLNELDPRFNYDATINECILTSNKHICQYILKLKEKNNHI